MSYPKVSVLVSTYNRAQFIAESLDSLFNQTIPPTQVIVVNDGCTDDTHLVLGPYLDRIEYIEQENTGKARALNSVAERATGDYVWIFDDDDVAISDALERHLKVLENHPELDFTYSTFCLGYTGEDGRIIPGKNVNTPNVSPEYFFLRLLKASFLSQPSMLVRTRVYRDVGPFDTQLIRSQDYDMVLRLARHYRGRMIEGPTFYRRIHAGPRGGAGDVFDHRQIAQKWHHYGKIIIGRFRQELELCEYLPRTPEGELSKHFDKRRAYLQRAAIMSIKGLWQEHLEDMQIIATLNNCPLSQDEVEICWSAMSNELSIAALLENSQWRRCLTNICRSSGLQQIRMELARGLYFTLTRHWRNLNLESKRTAAILTLQLAGPGNLAAAIIGKLRQRIVHWNNPHTRQGHL